MRIMHCLVIAVATFWPSIAHTPMAGPIRYKVDSNNRIFMHGDASRYVEDLHVYLRCADAIANVPNKCKDYRRRGTSGGVLVPHLRSGAEHDEYRVQYNKASHKFLDGYAVDRRRKLLLSVDQRWLTEQAVTAQSCAWRISVGMSYMQLASDSCTGADLDVELTLSEDGEKLGYNATAQLILTLSTGDKWQFMAEIVVRDILI